MKAAAIDFQFSKLLTILKKSLRLRVESFESKAEVQGNSQTGALEIGPERFQGSTMRIVALTDIHRAYSKVEEILAAEAPFDAAVIGGDLTTHGTIEEANGALRRFQRFGKPMVIIAGNMDLPAFESSYDDLDLNINAHGRRIGEVGFFGVAGSPFTPMHTPYELSEEEIGRRAQAGWQDVVGARWKIFVPHAPPRDTKLDKIFLGKHVGSTAVRAFVEQNQPDALICGHIHEARGIDTLGKTQMVNCGTAGKGFYAIIDIGETVKIELRG